MWKDEIKKEDYDSPESLVRQIKIECKRILDNVDTRTDKQNLVRGLNAILEAFDIITDNE